MLMLNHKVSITVPSTVHSILPSPTMYKSNVEKACLLMGKLFRPLRSMVA